MGFIRVFSKLSYYGRASFDKGRNLGSEDPAGTFYDLQFRLRCSHCRAFNGFEIVVRDVRNVGDNSKPCPERVIVSRDD